jgi:hypothetical protein
MNTFLMNALLTGERDSFMNEQKNARSECRSGLGPTSTLSYKFAGSRLYKTTKQLIDA